MKKLAVMCALLMTAAVSFQVSAGETQRCTTTSCMHSNQVLSDVQAYYSTGKMSESLATEVKELKESAGDISNDEAVGILADFAQRTLELY